jgi:hypothetical protein
VAHEYEAWDEVSVTIDTARLTPDQAVAMALKRLSGVE